MHIVIKAGQLARVPVTFPNGVVVPVFLKGHRGCIYIYVENVCGLSAWVTEGKGRMLMIGSIQWSCQGLHTRRFICRRREEWATCWGIWDVSLDLYFKERCTADEDFVRWFRRALSDCRRISVIETAWLLLTIGACSLCQIERLNVELSVRYRIRGCVWNKDIPYLLLSLTLKPAKDRTIRTPKK